jgi:hypothetical protein
MAFSARLSVYLSLGDMSATRGTRGAIPAFDALCDCRDAGTGSVNNGCKLSVGGRIKVMAIPTRKRFSNLKD